MLAMEGDERTSIPWEFLSSERIAVDAFQGDDNTDIPEGSGSFYPHYSGVMERNCNVKHLRTVHRRYRGHFSSVR